MPKMTSEIRILGIKGLPEVKERDDLSALITNSLEEAGVRLDSSDVLVIAQKIVSKSEGRVVDLNSIEPTEKAIDWAREYDKDARVVEVVLSESKRIVRMERGIIISETTHGFICANAGVDASNSGIDTVILLPEDPDASAKRIRAGLKALNGAAPGVIISDTFGRPWREGLVNVAIGVSGLSPLIDYRGKLDSFGKPLRATVLAVADELASAAELVMGKSDGVPVALIRGFRSESAEGSGRDLVRPAASDLFR